MRRSTQQVAVVALMLVIPVAATAARAQDARIQRRHAVHQQVADADRPLTIGRRRPSGRATGIIQVSPTEVYAPGGFSAYTYHPTFAQRQELRKDAYNEHIREASSGIYGYGLDGLGGTEFDTLHNGYENPNYGGAYNRYVGYNGVPSDLAFGPSFAFRHLSGHDPLDDDDEHGAPPVAPVNLGYTVNQVAPDDDE